MTLSIEKLIFTLSSLNEIYILVSVFIYYFLPNYVSNEAHVPEWHNIKPTKWYFKVYLKA